MTDRLDEGDEVSIPLDDLLADDALIRIRIGSAPAPMATIEVAR